VNLDQPMKLKLKITTALSTKKNISIMA